MRRPPLLAVRPRLSYTWPVVTFPASLKCAVFKIVRGLREALTVGGRYAVADHVISRHGDPWNLSEGARPKGGPTT